MAKTHHHTVKELKHDEFAEHVGDLWALYKKHRNAFWNSILIVAAVVLVIQVVRGQRVRATTESQSLITQGMTILGNPSPDMDPGEYQEAYVLFEKAATKYGKTRAGRSAELFMGDVRYRTGNYDEAASHYRAFLADNPNDDLAPRARLGVGYCLLADGKPQEAAEEFQAAAKSYPNSYVVNEALLGLAGSQEAAGDIEGARATLESLLGDATDPGYKNEAEARLGSLGSIPPTPDVGELMAEAERKAAEEAPPADEPETPPTTDEPEAE